MTTARNSRTIPGSFRDPSGFLFSRDGVLYRQVNTVYQEDYDLLMTSGLYGALVDDGLLIPHEEVEVEPAEVEGAHKVIRPEAVPFISYPYEWCFSELKDAALATLRIQQLAFEHGMSLKDASAYNIQFRGCKPVFIDTLSFEKYREGLPWVAYRQFCQHFLAPLALMSYRDIRLSQLLRVYIDGAPLDLASSLLPARTRFKLSLLCHIHLHAKSQQRFADKAVEKPTGKVSAMSLRGLIDNLQSTVKGLTWQPKGTEWGDYYYDTNYTDAAFEQKRQLLAEYLDEIQPRVAWDLGANTGVFSRVASEKGILTLSFDIDPAAVEKNYRDGVSEGQEKVLPLLLDLTNPPPGIGWQHEERMSLLERGPTDAAFALALIHHLAISNNLPFQKIGAFFAEACESLIIEFVPKSDSQVQRLLTTRDDIFTDYTQEAFEREMSAYFTIDRSAKIEGSERTLYLMRKQQS